MRVLHVIPSFWPSRRYGGPIAATRMLAGELVRQGHSVAVMTTNIDGSGELDVPLDRALVVDGAEVWYSPIGRPRWWCFSLPLSERLRRSVREFDVVHIHSVFLWPTIVAAYWCVQSGVPYIISPHGMLSPVCLRKPYLNWASSMLSSSKKRGYLATVGRFDLGKATALHFASWSEYEAARALGLRVPAFIIPIGIDVTRVNRDVGGQLGTLQCDRLRNKRLVVFLGRLDPVKGFDILIPALERLATKRSDFALVIAGSGSVSFVSRLVTRIARGSLQQRTVFVGHVEDDEKWGLLRAGDVFVLPSHHENFGVAVVEAMGAGLPVIISDGVGIHAEVHGAGAGMVVPRHPVELAEAVERVLDDDRLRVEMGRKAEMLVKKTFALERTVKDLVGVYEQLASS